MGFGGIFRDSGGSGFLQGVSYRSSFMQGLSLGILVCKGSFKGSYRDPPRFLKKKLDVVLRAVFVGSFPEGPYTLPLWN